MAASSALRAVAVEQLQQPAGEHAQMRAALGGAQEQRLGTGGGVMQTVLRAMGAGGALVSDQRLRYGLGLRSARRDRSCAGEWR